MANGNPLDNPVLRSAARLPLLPAEEERQLIERAQAGDSAAKQKLVAHNVKLAAQAVWRKKTHVSADDLMQEALRGLSEAIDKFDLEQSFRLISYATIAIKNRVHRAEFEERSIVIPPKQYQNAGRLKYQVRAERLRLIEEGFRGDELVNKTAENLEVSKGVVETCLMLMTGGDKSLNAPIGEEEDSGEFGDTLADTRPLADTLVEDMIDSDVQRSTLVDAINMLPARERKVIELRHFCEEGEAMTLEEVGNVFGVSKERIRQIETGALARLRKILRN